MIGILRNAISCAHGDHFRKPAQSLVRCMIKGMTRTLRNLALALAMFAGACASHHGHTDQTLAALVGRQVELSGVAEPRKLGAALVGDGFEVWVDQLQDWPAEFVGRRVLLTGILEERHDLPVFVEKAGETVIEGVSVPAGTDLHAARLRYVVCNARWSLAR